MFIEEPQIEEGKDTLSVAEFLAGWGGDPCYCHAPQLPQDGYTFYNYSVEGDNLPYLKDKLLPALGRLLQCPWLKKKRRDRANIEQVKEFIEAKIKSVEGGTAVPIFREEETFRNDNGVVIHYGAVRNAMKGEPFKMRLVGSDYNAISNTVNQGIDGRLQACFCPERGDFQSGKDFRISVESMPVLLRRLYEGDEKMQSLASGIMETLGFNESGKWTDPDEE